MARLLALLAVFALLPAVAHGEGFICVADMATGFAYDGGNWHSANFEAGKKFVVRRPTPVDQGYFEDVIKLPNATNLKWVVSETENALPIFACTGDFTQLGNLLCPPVGAGPSERYDLSALNSPSYFRMNKNTLRFLFAYLTGYWGDKPDREGRDSPLLAIGKCGPM